MKNAVPTWNDVDIVASPLVFDAMPLLVPKKKVTDNTMEETRNKKQRVDFQRSAVVENIGGDDAIALVRQEMSSLPDKIDKYNAEMNSHVDRRILHFLGPFFDT